MDRAAAFDRLYDEHHRATYAYLLGRTCDQAAAEDLLQETFLRIWRNLDTAVAVPVERRRFHVISVARSAANDALRKAKRRIEVPLYEADAVTRGEDYESNETVRQIDAAMACLPEGARVMLTMSVLEEMTSEEVGAALGVSAGTVRYEIHRARRRLRELMETL